METLVFLFSFSALGILYAMNTIPEFQEPYVILATGVAVLVIVFLFYFIITRGNPPKDFLFFGYVHTYRSNYASRLAKAFPTNKPLQLMPWVTLVGLKRVFAVFSFTCVIDLISALEHDGIVSGFMEFYQKTGEPYLGSAYSIMMCYWDGIVHFIMYLVMISRITDRKAYRTPGLFWAGSLCANMSVFIVGIVAGKYGSEIHPAFWLNFLFLLMPVLGAITLFSRPKDRPLIGGYTATHAQSMKLIWRPTDLVLILLLIAAMAFTILRGLVALDSPIEVCSSYLKHYEPYLKDPVGYPRITMLHLLFYGLPLLGASVYGLLKPGCTWMSDWTLFLAGGMMQCQWAHIGGSLHHRTTAPFRIPNECFWLVLAANLVYAATPVLVAMRVNGNPHFFLKISPFPGQTGLPISEEKDTKYKDK